MYPVTNQQANWICSHALVFKAGRVVHQRKCGNKAAERKTVFCLGGGTSSRVNLVGRVN